MDKEKVIRMLNACLLAFEEEKQEVLEELFGKEEAIAGIKLAKFLKDNY